MSNDIRAVLDDETEAIRKRLNAEGWTDSEIIRRAIQALSASIAPKRQFTGAGKYDSGITDLASNKKYLDGLGES
jgi:hypothetical protein